MLRNVYVHDIFKPSLSGGIGIRIAESDLRGSGQLGKKGSENSAGISDVLVEKCRIERTAYSGILARGVRNLSFIDNELKDIGGPGIQPGGCQNLVLRGMQVGGAEVQ